MLGGKYFGDSFGRPTSRSCLARVSAQNERDLAIALCWAKSLMGYAQLEEGHYGELLGEACRPIVSNVLIHR